MSRRKRLPVHDKPPAEPQLSSVEMVLLLALVTIPALFNIQSGASFEPEKAAIMISLALVAVSGRFWQARRTGSLRKMIFGCSPWRCALLGLAILGGVITATAVDPVTSLWGNYERGYGLLTLLAGLVFMHIAWEMARSGKVWVVVDAAIVGAIIPLWYGYLQMLGFDPVRGMGVSFPLGERAASTLGNPLYFGDYLLLVSVLMLARRLLRPPNRKGARLFLDGMLLFTIGLLALTFSRSAYLGAAAAGGVLLLFGWRQRRSRMGASRLGSRGLLAGVGGLMAGLVGALVLFWPQLQHGGTLQQRLLIWQAVVDMTRDQPRIWALGLGFDTLPLAIAPYLPTALGHFEPDFVFRIPDRAHSLPLELVTTGGLPWLLAWLGLGGWLLWRLWRSDHPLAGFLAAAIVGRGLLLSVSFPTHAPDLLFFALMGLGFGLDQTRKEEAARSPTDTLFLLAVGAAGAFGFSMSAAWPGGLAVWLLSLPVLAMGMAALMWRPSFLPPRWTWLLLAFLLPALLWNRHLGADAIWAWLWLLAWFILCALTPLATWSFAQARRPDIAYTTSQAIQFVFSMTLVVWLLALPFNLPRLGDIAYKSAWLTSDPDLRQAYYQRALMLAPYDHVMATGMAWRMRQLATILPAQAAELNQAIAQDYEEAMAAQPLAPEPVAAYARWLATQPDAQQEALRMFDRARHLSPNDPQLLSDRAMTLAATGEREQAIEELRQLLTLDPLYGPAYLHLAQLYEQLGDDASARAIIDAGKAKVPWWEPLQTQP